MALTLQRILLIFAISIPLLYACRAKSEAATVETAESTPESLQFPQPSQTPAEELSIEKQNTPEPISPGSSLCELPQSGNLLISKCEDGLLKFSQVENRKKVDIFTLREVPVEGGGISLESEVISSPAPGLPLDENQYGLFLVDSEGVYHAIRLSGQYFNFEKWEAAEDIVILDLYNRVYTPLIHPANQKNRIKLTCTETGCDLALNDELAGRIPTAAGSFFRKAGLFTASSWDQVFGEVTFSSFKKEVLSSNLPESQIYLLMDDLREDHGTFSGAGLSGAFNDYDQDGFHFSPVVPFNIYTAKAGPAFADSSVQASVKMNIQPGVSGSQFAGLICRASQEGMVMAVIRVDGTYTIFRDTPRRPMAVLARKASDSIHPGLSVNKLRLDCRGNQIDFFINDILVASFTDTRYGVRFGRSGFYTKSGSLPDPDAIIFSDLQIEELR